MCGRFVFDSSLTEIKDRFAAKAMFDEFSPRYNIAPGMFMPIILENDGRIAVLARWGLIPFWAKNPQIGYKMINARAEGLSVKPAFRKPFINQRCLVPATGFFEWQRIEKDKIPFLFHLKSINIFAFAGLYEYWKDAEGRPLTTFTIITTVPNAVVAKVHNRMPVILSPTEENTWLSSDSNSETLIKLLDQYPADAMESYRVSRDVNNPGNDSPAVIQAEI